MDSMKVNFAFVAILLALFIGAMLPVDGLVKTEKFESLKVPVLELPEPLRKIESDKSGQYAAINTDVLLGMTPTVIAAVQKKKREEKARKEEKSRPKPKPAPRLVLRAVMIEGDSRIANINGALVKVGGSVRKHKVKKIDESGVVLDGPWGQRTLTMR